VAALLLREAAVASPEPYWGCLFGPLVAASSGAFTTLVLGGGAFVLAIPAYAAPEAIDLVAGSVIGVLAAIIGLVAVYAFAPSHRAFRCSARRCSASWRRDPRSTGRDRWPTQPRGRGLDQMRQLVAQSGTESTGHLAYVAIVRMAAVVIASTAGFRGGRIFPSLFAGVALGLAVHAVDPGLPEALAIAASLVGLLLAVTRGGWLALFIGAVLVGEADILPVLCIALLPAWLIVSSRPEMIVRSGVMTPSPAESGTTSMVAEP
jgi:H+/Cl- antiporter ClcA